MPLTSTGVVASTIKREVEHPRESNQVSIHIPSVFTNSFPCFLLSVVINFLDCSRTFVTNSKGRLCSSNNESSDLICEARVNHGVVRRGRTQDTAGSGLSALFASHRSECDFGMHIVYQASSRGHR